MLSVNDLEAMQATVNDSLPDTAIILSRQGVPDGVGGHTEQFVPTMTCAARIVSSDALAKQQGGKINSEATQAILIQNGIDIAPGDRVQIGDSVFHVIDGTSGQTWDIVRRITVKEL